MRGHMMNTTTHTLTEGSFHSQPWRLIPPHPSYSSSTTTPRGRLLPFPTTQSVPHVPSTRAAPMVGEYFAQPTAWVKNTPLTGPHLLSPEQILSSQLKAIA